MFEGKLDVIAHTLPWAPATSYFYWQRNRNQTFFLATFLRPRRKCYKSLIFLWRITKLHEKISNLILCHIAGFELVNRKPIHFCIRLRKFLLSLSLQEIFIRLERFTIPKSFFIECILKTAKSPSSFTSSVVFKKNFWQISYTKFLKGTSDIWGNFQKCRFSL